MGTVYVLLVILLARLAGAQEVPDLLGVCTGASGSAGAACVGETVTCVSRVVNGTAAGWVLRAATVDGGSVLAAPVVLGPGDTFDGAAVRVATAPGFLEVETTALLDAVDGSFTDYTAVLRPFVEVVVCDPFTLRARRRAQRARTYRARCADDPTFGVRVCRTRDETVFTAGLR